MPITNQLHVVVCTPQQNQKYSNKVDKIVQFSSMGLMLMLVEQETSPINRFSLSRKLKHR